MRDWKCETKMQGWKMQERKMWDQNARVENAGLENAGKDSVWNTMHCLFLLSHAARTE